MLPTCITIIRSEVLHRPVESAVSLIAYPSFFSLAMDDLPSLNTSGQRTEHRYGNDLIAIRYFSFSIKKPAR